MPRYNKWLQNHHRPYLLVNCNVQLSCRCSSTHSNKSKALSYLRDTPADQSQPIVREGELNVKVTFIDGKVSVDDL